MNNNDQDIYKNWNEPEELPSGLPKVMKFNESMLPNEIKDWVVDIASRMQCPIDFLAVASIISLSSLVGARCVIAPKKYDDWKVVPNLWGVLIGRPGVKKTPAIQEAISPLYELERLEYAKSISNNQIDLADENSKEDDSKTKRKKKEDIGLKNRRRFLVGDTSVEMLAEILKHNPFGICLYRDELESLFGDMSKPGQESARAFYLQIHSGNQSYHVDRIGRGSNYIDNMCASLIGGTQPNKLLKHVYWVVNGTADDGLLQRISLAVWPDIDSDFKYVDRVPNEDAKNKALDVFKRLSEINPGDVKSQFVWRFSSDAQDIFVKWYTELEIEIRSGKLILPLESLFAKYAKTVASLALIFSIIDTPTNNFIVEKNELCKAIEWYRYLRSHAERIYGALEVPSESGPGILLNAIKTHFGSSNDLGSLSFTAREISQKNWSGLASVDYINQAASILVEYGYLKKQTKCSGSAGGRPSLRYLINPFLFKTR